MEADVVETFRDSINQYFLHRSDYVSVHALLISWSENDISPEQEIRNLRRVLEADYQYQVTALSIPTNGQFDDPQLRLNVEISSFIECSSHRRDSLIIIYYAGHCSADKAGRAQWSAFEEGGPTVCWHVTQQLLFHAVGDVLLILDCCNAAMIAKGVKGSGRFEMIAASAKGFKTPVPGRSSFTKIMTRELGRHTESGISASSLCSLLLENERMTGHTNTSTETPIYDDLARTSRTSLILKRLEPPSDPRFKKKPASLLMIRISLSDDINAMEMADWFKTAPPRNVTAVEIEAVVTKAIRMQELSSKEIFSPRSLFSKLSAAAQDEIRRQFRGLDTTMANAKKEIDDPATAGDAWTVQDTFSRLDESVSGVCSAVQSSALLDLDRKYYEEAIDDLTLDVTDTSTALSLRNALVNTQVISEDQEIGRDRVRIVKTIQRLKIGKIDGHMVIIEAYRYWETVDKLAAAKQQVRRLSDILCRPKHVDFHILPGIGFFQDKAEKEFCLVFEPPVYFEEKDDVVSLSELYTREKLVALDHRIQLAYSLCRALDCLHKVAWVHKGLRPDNVVFVDKCHPPRLPEVSKEMSSRVRTLDSLPSVVDFTTPLLFGFEYARPGHDPTNLEEDYSLENNVYRHPNRWGRPTVRFEKSHDVYSLGVILLEIAFWKDVKSILDYKKTDRISATGVREKLMKRSRERLPHMVGKVFTDVILLCLSYDEHIIGKSEYEIQGVFQQRVLDRLKNKTVHI
ncbi:hypothetical protein P154DRAFT_494309 [Amniculicola lignicola CBS 123094]|uniref:Protein kinase domain-containing protein n=1 Tax=Amniculicola lignicola CBS 123094 TaxID=1392246 RepID=A0A6A5WCU3_9PLEO|nr:hypothetical protein P154DRAFT_494309 [Amniculicola lignicola CBS 123094]